MGRTPARKDVWNPADTVEEEIDQAADDLEMPGIENKDQTPRTPAPFVNAEDRPDRGAKRDNDPELNESP